ncbi:winged helix-turn-helix domain-containing protein [Thermococcus sp.]
MVEMRPPTRRERIYMALWELGRGRVAELSRVTELPYPYVHREIRRLEREGVIVNNAGSVEVPDRKAFVMLWAEDKRRIFERVKGMRVKLLPGPEILLSGSAALWAIGKVLSPAGGVAYVRKPEEALKLRSRRGYALSVYAYDDFAFRFAKGVGRFRVSPWGMVLADLLAQGMYTRLFEEVFEEVVGNGGD